MTSSRYKRTLEWETSQRRSRGRNGDEEVIETRQDNSVADEGAHVELVDVEAKPLRELACRMRRKKGETTRVHSDDEHQGSRTLDDHETG